MIGAIQMTDPVRKFIMYKTENLPGDSRGVNEKSLAVKPMFLIWADESSRPAAFFLLIWLGVGLVIG
jgi:hypothetical protein